MDSEIAEADPSMFFTHPVSSDPLPFQALVRCHSHAENVKFIDVDYKPLMLTKRDMIMKTPKLKACLNNIQCFDDEEDPVVLQSYEYLGVGCDLQDVTSLDQALKAHFDISKCKVLFLAEVSTTYMEPDAANALIAWAAKSADSSYPCSKLNFRN